MSKKETHQVSPQSLIKSHSLKDQLEYVADLLLELKEMASKHNLSTLAGLLELAHAEASLRAKDRD